MRGFFKRREHTQPTASTEAGPEIATRRAPAQRDRQPTDGELVRTGSNCFAASSPAWRSADDHAIALLRWMQGPGGREGEVPARELMRAHADMCTEYFWEPLPWIPVAKAFRRLIDDPKHRYASRNSRRIVVYLIPPRMNEQAPE